MICLLSSSIPWAVYSQTNHRPTTVLNAVAMSTARYWEARKYLGGFATKNRISLYFTYPKNSYLTHHWIFDYQYPMELTWFN